LPKQVANTIRSTARLSLGTPAPLQLIRAILNILAKAFCAVQKHPSPIQVTENAPQASAAIIRGWWADMDGQRRIAEINSPQVEEKWDRYDAAVPLA
jgi:hypothetical protein